MVTPPAQVAWRTALYRVAVDGGMCLGPLVSGILTARHPDVEIGRHRFQCRIAIRQRSNQILAEDRPVQAAIVVSQAHIGIETDGGTVIGDRQIVFPLHEMDVSTIVECNRIVVLDGNRGGKVAERQVLLALGGVDRGAID